MSPDRHGTQRDFLLGEVEPGGTTCLPMYPRMLSQTPPAARTSNQRSMLTIPGRHVCCCAVETLLVLTYLNPGLC